MLFLTKILNAFLNLRQELMYRLIALDAIDMCHFSSSEPFLL